MEELKYFFSYTRKDSEFVLKLAKELRAVGANLWLDQLDILGGQHWDSTVEKALKSCKGMIAVLSPESVASDNVMDEVSYALNEGKLVVPVLIRPCNIPYRLQRLQYIDFTADYETGFTQLLRALGIEQPVEPAAAQKPVVQEPSLPEQPESAVGEQKEAEVRSKRQKTKVLAAICIVMLIAIVSIVIFRKYLKTYSLSATADPNGSVEKSPDKISYKHGETVKLEAVPNPGYSFTNWSGDLDDSTNPATLVMDADKSVTASFTSKALTVITRSNAHDITEISRVPIQGFCVGWFRNSERFAVLPFDGSVSIVDPKQTDNLKTLDLGIRSSKFALNPVDDLIAVNDLERHEVRVVDLADESTVKVFQSEASQPGMAFRSDGLFLAIAGYGSPVDVWNSISGDFTRRIVPSTKHGGLTLEFHPRRNLLAVGNRNDVTELFDVNTGRPIQTLNKKMSHEVEFSPNGSRVAVAYVDGKVGIWEVGVERSGPTLVSGDPTESLSIAWSPNGEILATAGRNGKISLWDTASMKILHAISVLDAVFGLEFSRDGTMLLSGAEGFTQVWGLEKD